MALFGRKNVHQQVAKIDENPTGFSIPLDFCGYNTAVLLGIIGNIFGNGSQLPVVIPAANKEKVCKYGLLTQI